MTHDKKQQIQIRIVNTQPINNETKQVTTTKTENKNKHKDRQ